MAEAGIEMRPMHGHAKEERPKHGAYWRRTLWQAIAAVSIILIINFAILGWAIHRQNDDGIATIYRGSEGSMGTVHFVTHGVINIFGALLLMTCNACMQCLSAPTRIDVDKVHAKHDWLDIGISSARNLRHVSLWRGVLWSCLLLSSFPIALLYNSVVFTSPGAIDYMAVLVTPEFLAGGPHRQSPNDDSTLDGSTNMTDDIKTLQNDAQSLVRLEKDDCYKKYNVPVQTDLSHVLLVSDYSAPNDTVIYVFEQSTGSEESKLPGWTSSGPDNWGFTEPTCNGAIRYGWTDYQGLPETCTTSTTVTSDTTLVSRAGGFWQPPDDGDSDATQPGGQVRVNVDYCLAKPLTEPACEVNVSVTLLAVVIVFNIVKLLCLIATLMLPRFEPLITIGDAMASFFVVADSHTERQGLLFATEVTSGSWRLRSMNRQPPRPRTWTQPPLGLYSTVQPLKWAINLMVILFVFIGGAVMLYVGSHWGKWTPGFRSQGLGVINPAFIIPETVCWDVLSTVVLANTPQLFISGAYFSFNYLLTTMLLCKAFSEYAASGKSNAAAEAARTSTNDGLPLRVSEPVKQSEQIGNWQMSLPWAYSIPLFISMFLLHLFTSLALFAVRVGSYASTGERRSYLSGVGWSMRGIIAAVAVGAVMILGLAGLAVFGKMDRGAPVVGSCSVAIAAACHARADDRNVGLKRVRFGVVQEVNVDGEAVGRVGFGSSGVRPLKEGEEYV
ncbi:hypothetical protein B0A48_00817 [Cryoendolithus antarcticus]|uniref:DUF6536 domain-containing protein n=1 Tax=Cryoendolithus antarcticus TaxID=1507870 RepID=A0A1V8TRV8_9PEZI|nr:hypothetical protein B0A48_00817 [Cryoendolithus antarcticus]